LEITLRKKSTHWDSVRKELRPKFAVAGLIDRCELNWEKCLANKDGFVPKTFQTFAHSLRRRKIDRYLRDNPSEYERLMREVCRVCVKCHEQLDNPKNFTHEEACEIIRNTIKNRKKPVQ
jgi:hypothetical protein